MILTGLIVSSPVVVNVEIFYVSASPHVEQPSSQCLLWLVLWGSDQVCLDRPSSPCRSELLSPPPLPLYLFILDGSCRLCIFSSLLSLHDDFTVAVRFHHLDLLRLNIPSEFRTIEHGDDMHSLSVWINRVKCNLNFKQLNKQQNNYNCLMQISNTWWTNAADAFTSHRTRDRETDVNFFCFWSTSAKTNCGFVSENIWVRRGSSPSLAVAVFQGLTSSEQ